MPGPFDQYRKTPAAPAPVAGDALAKYRKTPAPPEEESGVNPWAVGAGALGLGAAALAAKNPALLGKAWQGFTDLRRMSMLSGLATPKSLLGNVGGSVYSSIERGSLAPLKEMLSPATVRDAVSTFKAMPNTEMSGPATAITRFNLPGRVMGAMDTAAQNALQRAGLTDIEAKAEMLQAPLPQGLATALENPVMDYLVPFRRTPFNQLIEGGKSFAPQTKGQALALGTSLATGAATGAMAEDPKTIALGTAFSGRRGLPFALAAGAGRYLASGSKAKGMDAIQGMSPVSDYSLGQGVVGPLATPMSGLIPKPAAIGAYDYLKKLLGMQ